MKKIDCIEKQMAGEFILGTETLNLKRGRGMLSINVGEGIACAAVAIGAIVLLVLYLMLRKKTNASTADTTDKPG